MRIVFRRAKDGTFVRCQPLNIYSVASSKWMISRIFHTSQRPEWGRRNDTHTHTHKLRGSCSIETFWWAAAHRLNASCNVTRAYAAEVLVHFRFLRSTLRLILMHSTNTQANLLKATCTTQQPNTQRLRYIDNICRYKVLQSNQNELCLPFTVSTLCHRYSCKRQQML